MEFVVQLLRHETHDVDIAGMQPVGAMVPEMANARSIAIGPATNPLFCFKNNMRDAKPGQRQPSSYASRTRPNYNDIRILNHHSTKQGSGIPVKHPQDKARV